MSLTELIHSTTHIIGGTPVQQGRFQFQAGILQDGSQFCGGSLIAPNVILTAAHCAQTPAMDVVLGCEDINDLSQCEVISVKKSLVFEAYGNDGWLGNDIQLLVLESNSVQKPIALAAPGFDLNVGQDLTVIGWGVTNPVTKEDSGGILLEALVESITQEACIDRYKDLFGSYGSGTFTPFPGTVVNDFKMCAVGESKDTCQGDSGGPIFMRCDATGEDVQVGIVSFGLGCAYDGIPGIYTTVFHPDAFEFIDNVVSNQGHSLKTIESTSEFCVVGGTQPPEELSDPPTPFPSFDLAGWTCNDRGFAENDGCHCNCGIPDPDCEFDEWNVVNCEPDEICVEGFCADAGNSTESPTPGNRIPPEWICFDSFYGDAYCDCNCGAPDPDCEPGAELVSDTLFGCLGNEICIEGICSGNEKETLAPTPYNGVPPDWICDDYLYNDTDCNCNCGAPDPDCEPGADLGLGIAFGCEGDEICVDAVCVTPNDTFSPSSRGYQTDSPTPAAEDDDDDNGLQDIIDEVLGLELIVIWAIFAVVIILALSIWFKCYKKQSATVERDLKNEADGQYLYAIPVTGKNL